MGLLIIRLAYYSTIFKVIGVFSQYHPLLLSGLASVIINFINFDKSSNIILSILSLILVIVGFIIILIFVEIIELNFCGLSYMTKKNIKIRARLDSVLVYNEDDNETTIHYEDYSIDLIETKRNEINLNNTISDIDYWIFV